jgi:hypothetical protein
MRDVASMLSDDALDVPTSSIATSHRRTSSSVRMGACGSSTSAWQRRRIVSTRRVMATSKASSVTWRPSSCTTRSSIVERTCRGGHRSLGDVDRRASLPRRHRRFDAHACARADGRSPEQARSGHSEVTRRGRVEGASTSPVEAIVLREGERADVSVIFASAPAPEPPRDERRVPTMAYVSGAVAAAGLVGFGVLAGVGYSDWSDSGCGTSCVRSDAERVRTTLLVADVSLAIWGDRWRNRDMALPDASNSIERHARR